MPAAPPQLPSLVAVSATGVELARLEPSPRVMHKEPWAMGVIAIEAESQNRRLFASVRAVVTGKAPSESVLVGRFETVHVFLLRQGAAPELPEPSLPRVGEGILGGVALFIGGQPSKVAMLDARNAYDRPPPRSTTQVYCRWLRDGSVELGCDMTDFLSLVQGARAPKLFSRFVERDAVVSVALI